MAFNDPDHKQLTEMIDGVLKAVVITQVSVPQARDALADLLTAAARGNETEVREWHRWKEECQKANEQM